MSKISAIIITDQALGIARSIASAVDFVALLWVYYDLTIEMKLYEFKILKTPARAAPGDAF